MPDQSCRTIPPGPSTRDTGGEKHRRAHTSGDEARGLAWLSWKSNNQEHGLKSHKVNPDGSIKEIEDQAPEPRRKPKTVSSQQWGR